VFISGGAAVALLHATAPRNFALLRTGTVFGIPRLAEAIFGKAQAEFFAAVRLLAVVRAYRTQPVLQGAIAARAARNGCLARCFGRYAVAIALHAQTVSSTGRCRTASSVGTDARAIASFTLALLAANLCPLAVTRFGDAAVRRSQNHRAQAARLTGGLLLAESIVVNAAPLAVETSTAQLAVSRFFAIIKTTCRAVRWFSLAKALLLADLHGGAGLSGTLARHEPDGAHRRHKYDGRGVSPQNPCELRQQDMVVHERVRDASGFAFTN